jgi:hypothetical protein
MVRRTAMTVLLAATLGIASAGAETPTTSPLLGIWKLDVSKLPLPPGAKPPRSVTLVVAEVGQGRWKTTIDTVNADGTTRHSEATYGIDGTPAAVSDSMGGEVDTVSITRPTPSTLIMGTTLGGNLGTTRVFTVLPDGRHQTETVVWRGDDGKPHTRTNAWTRVER